MSKREVVIVSGARTPVGDFGGALKSVSPCDLASLVVKEAVKRAGVAPENIGHCVFGSVLHTERRDMYISRVAALNGGLPEGTPSLTVNRLCGSGLQAIISAAQLIMLGDCDAAVAGGAESMSRVPYWIPEARFGMKMGDGSTLDPMVGALTCPMKNYHMGVTAENVAEKYSIPRDRQDQLASESHNRAQRARENGFFKDQIVPVEIKTRKGSTVFEQDEHIRDNCTAESLSGLAPVFKKDGSVTAGNASGLNDAAAAVVLMERVQAEAKGLTPMAKLVGYAVTGVDPAFMGMGPVSAVEKLLLDTGVSKDEIGIWEINEAFAAQALAVVEQLGLDPQKVNPNGSGISLGHPIGASGAIICVKALYEMKRVNARYAIATMCIGGGQGIALLFESLG